MNINLKLLFYTYDSTSFADSLCTGKAATILLVEVFTMLLNPRTSLNCSLPLLSAFGSELNLREVLNRWTGCFASICCDTARTFCRFCALLIWISMGTNMINSIDMDIKKMRATSRKYLAVVLSSSMRNSTGTPTISSCNHPYSCGEFESGMSM